MSIARVKLLKTQKEFFKSDFRHTAYIGGFGSGKSAAGIAKTILKKVQYKDKPVAYYLPTYGLIRDIAFVKFAEELEKWGLKYTLNKSDKEFHVEGYGKIIMRGMDNPATIVGYEVAYSCIDEADILPEKKMNLAWTKIIARNRIKLDNGEINMTDVVSTPEGYRFVYKMFEKSKKQNRRIIKARTADNPFVSEDYINSLKDSYSTDQLKAYLNGEFVNLTSGNVYKSYDRELNHSNRRRQGSEVLHIGVDFNITNMNAVIHVIDDFPIAIEEIVKGYDTADVISIIKDRYPNNPIVIYPDSAGKARNTSGRTDFELLKEAGFKIVVSRKNPFIRDRVNAMNIVFANSRGERKYFVNTNNCPSYTEALETITYKDGEPDKEGGLDHITEAGGYFIFQNTYKKRGLII